VKAAEKERSTSAACAVGEGDATAKGAKPEEKGGRSKPYAELNKKNGSTKKKKKKDREAPLGVGGRLESTV